MRTYRPVHTTNPELNAVQTQIQQAANRADPFAELQYLHAEPVKVRPGILALADGADWNPGSGEGLYRRNAANSAWVYLG